MFEINAVETDVSKVRECIVFVCFSVRVRLRITTVVVVAVA